MVRGKGHGHDAGALEQVVKQFRGAAAHLDSANGAAVDLVDAGASSEVVGTALAKLLDSSVLAAEYAEEVADRVNTTKGTYTEVESDNEANFGGGN